MAHFPPLTEGSSGVKVSTIPWENLNQPYAAGWHTLTIHTFQEGCQKKKQARKLQATLVWNYDPPTHRGEL